MDLKKIVASTTKTLAKYESKPDSVRWTAYGEDNKEVGQWAFTYCYSPIIPELASYQINCLPWGGPSKGQMPALWYRHFFHLLKQVGLCPPEALPLRKKGANCLILPRSDWDRHTIYITLCYYRQMDQAPAELMKALLLWRRLAKEGTHFLQILHYIAMTTKYACGHYFMTKPPYGTNVACTDLAAGQALAWFANLTKEQRLELCPAGKHVYTYLTLANKAKEMESVDVGELEELLNPKYADYYRNPKVKS